MAARASAAIACISGVPLALSIITSGWSPFIRAMAS
jgi:hypothetical protein